MLKFLGSIALAFFVAGMLLGVLLIPSTPAIGAYFRAPTRISLDLGGSVLKYLTDYSEARGQHTRYVLDGLCVSACTMITAEIPNDRVCVTPYAKLAFHAAFVTTAKGERVFSPEATDLLWRIYPDWVRQFLRKNGWESPTTDQPTLIWMEAKDLQVAYKTCSN
jgi:hypothetical protein